MEGGGLGKGGRWRGQIGGVGRWVAGGGLNLP